MIGPMEVLVIIEEPSRRFPRSFQDPREELCSLSLSAVVWTRQPPFLSGKKKAANAAALSSTGSKTGTN